MPTVTILVDNTVATPNPKGLRGEWGFAAAIDDILFDTGQSDVIVHNARLLDVPTTYRDIILSHTHYDHTAGIDHFLDATNKPSVYLHPDVWQARYQTEGPDGALDEPIHIGIPFSRAQLESGAELIEHRDPVEVREGMYALGEIPRTHAEATVGKIEHNGRFEDDPILDDQSVAISTEAGTALVLGCCHAGLKNSIEYAEAVTGDDVRFVIGGTHLVALETEEIHRLADWLESRLELFAGTHCTGFEAESILARRLPDAFAAVGVGSTIELPPLA